MLSGDEKTKMITRLNRIEGQISGINRMIQDETYCVDVLHQFSAVQGALAKAAELILKSHLESCVSRALAEGDDAERQTKLKELVDVFSRFGRVVGK